MMVERKVAETVLWMVEQMAATKAVQTAEKTAETLEEQKGWP